MRPCAPLLLAAIVASAPLAPAALAESAAPVTSGAPGARPKVVFDQPSAYGRVIVVEEARSRALRLDDVDAVDQSIMSLEDPASVPMEYVRYAGLALLFVPEPASVLMIGLGGGSFSGVLHRVLPAARIDVVEINPVVVEAAKRFFGLVEDERYRVHIADGADFIHTGTARYDLIVADAGSGDGGIPESLTTARFFSAVRERLSPGGVLVLNLGLDEQENMVIAGRVKAAFAGGTCAGVSTPVDANHLVFATMNPRAPDVRQLRMRAATLDSRRLLPYVLAPLAAQVGRCP